MKAIGVVLMAGAAAMLAAAAGGCRAQGGPREPAESGGVGAVTLRPIVAPPGGDRADAERACLARLVGSWTFEGSTEVGAGDRAFASGRAAGVIEREHFVQLDMDVTLGAMGGRSSRKAGSMLFASEPGIGLTLTAWGDASPSITRLTGRADAGASEFRFEELPTAPGKPRHALVIRFQSDDRWTAEVREIATSGALLVASYTFTRAAP